MYSGDYEPVPRTPTKAAGRPDDEVTPEPVTETKPVAEEPPTALGDRGAGDQL